MRRLTRGRGEDGAVAIIVALCVSLLLVVAALVVDFGLVRIDRQVDKSAADSATLAGLHALADKGSTDAHPYRGVCTAVRFLKQNSERFSSINENLASGWTKGDGVTAAGASGCDPTMAGRACVPGDASTWARFEWSGTWDGAPLSVLVQSGYDLAGSGWAEDTLAASQADEADDAQGCDQLVVVVSQTRKPGLGSLATSSDLQTAIRSVGRVKLHPGGYAPAMLLLKQHGCSILTAGSSAGGSQIKVLGAGSFHFSQPGTIHADSDGAGCASNSNIFTGQADNGIVAYAAPLLNAAGNATTTVDPSKPGEITAYAVTMGLGGTTVRDSTEKVCGSALLSSAAGDPCPGQDVKGRDRVYREPVDERYLQAVSGMSAAAVTAFATASSIPKVIASCTPTQANVDALGLTSTSSVYVSCTDNNGFRPAGALSIPAGTVVFAGLVNPQGDLSLPNATHVYIAGNNNGGLKLGGSGANFRMHTRGPGGVDNRYAPPDPLAGQCSNAATNTQNKAVLVIKNNTIDESNGSTLQLCYTTVLMKGGQTAACLPALDLSQSQLAPNPTTPCGGGTGTGQLKQTGGNVDWTAPNRYAQMLIKDADGNAVPDPAKEAEWKDPNGPEDLAFWSESGGNDSNPKYQMTGGGSVHLVGVLMTPNAQPFNLSGQFNQSLVNAQYIASSIALSSNNTNITMSVDPNSAVTVPELQIVGLVR